MKIIIINGPNLDMLGCREPDIYGNQNLDKINQSISEKYSGKLDIEFIQSNSEKEIIHKLHYVFLKKDEYDAVIINPAAFTHYSIAIRDALKMIEIPKIEVHLSNIFHREDFRKKTVTGAECDVIISGCGAYGYILAVDYILNVLKNGIS